MIIKNEKIAVWSDLHLGVHQNSLFWHDVSLKWVDWFVLELEKRGIKKIIFMGDFFDHRDEIAVNTLDVGYRVLSKLKDFSIIIIPGNHDSFYKDHADINSLNIIHGWSNIILLTKTSQLMLGTKLATFVPWGGEPELAKMPKSDYIFGHLEINTFRYNNAKVCEKGINPSTILSISPKVYSGHFHLRDKRMYQESFINYVGNPFETNFGDINNQKGFFILDLENDTEEFVPNTISPTHHKIFISDITNNDVQKYADIIPDNIIRLVVDSKTDADTIDKIQNNINLFKPAACTIEFLLGVNNIDMQSIENLDISGVDMGQSIEEFVNNLDVADKAALIAECLEYYKDIK